MQSVFAQFENEAFPYRFEGSLHVPVIVGGTPKDANKAEGWIKSKLGATEDLLRQKVADTMLELGIGADEAAEVVNANQNLNGFKRDDEGLYIEGRQLKAALKEAVSVSVAADKLRSRGWGKTNKGLLSYMAEHVFVLDERLHLGVDKPSGVLQRFIHTFRGNGIQYEEYVEDAHLDFTVVADHDFTDKEWATIWTTGQHQGIGASRSQGYGVYAVTKWDRVG